MTRTDGDTWDIVTSVGATALIVSAMRAIEARKPDPLARDDYAQHFVAATKTEAPIFSEVLEDPAAAQEPDIQLFSSYLGARTKYFDEFFLAAGDAGVRQAVILASGLDVRGYRLPWADGTTVYELDLPKVLEFKKRVLDEHGAQTTATVHDLHIDLRDDWPVALKAAGFDATRPTAWLAEGLLPFLPGAAQDLLFQRIAELSAPGSRVAVEDFGAPGNQADRMSNAMENEEGALQRIFKSIVEDDAAPSSLWFGDEREDPALWLTSHGWTVEATTAGELLQRYNRAPLAGEHELTDAIGQSRYFTAVLGA
ncbi:class I SAM-dependent methyltransferase [Mycobacteroides immunogenum]|uniref:S-adenosyl-L-methionine-dependent methyltransferase n=1 Tax=Mycobacteroides immunogenum TaxID=83262 RepID=A0A7V8RYY6_9MYCO|nr:class I SAM-dependent methyltransferase [Mycobacteroides immunogenum]AMT73141.1 SAM-dependent methyltransferase [Mycobacteroides immunogenum]ANO06300.1 SAM-dependent methyltransferase [Mycobacteroides immunogenum]KIU41720.1 SAM-dependent methyltransferase [Mycobacteroides immunogenum]KPG11535.1 SAM-dependent methyltransferase [Mycobacteroides immunogenum]KPG11978.1 SAM-dependent methyltransferase [Mycobacteroides immunogenum]